MVIAEKISRNANMVAAPASLVKRKIAEMWLIKPIKKLQGNMEKFILIVDLISKVLNIKLVHERSIRS